MSPDRDESSTPEANSLGQPEQPQAPVPPQNGEQQSGMQNTVIYPSAQSQESVQQTQGIDGSQQVIGQQIKTKQSKSKMPIIIAILVVVLLVGGLIGFLVFGADSGNEDANTSGSQNESVSDNVDSAFNDNQRKTDVIKFVSEAVTYQGNNNGRVPTFEVASTELISEYVLTDDTDEFNDPTTNTQYVVVEGTPEIGQIQYAEASECSGDEIVAAGSRQVAARTLLESGELYCVSP